MSTVRYRIERNKSLLAILALNPALRFLIVFLCGIAFLSIFKISIITVGIFFGLFVISALIKKSRLITYLCGIITISAFTALQIQQIPSYSKNIVIPDMSGTFKGKVDNIIKTSDKFIRLKVTGNVDLKYADPFDDCGVFLTIFRPDNKCRELKPGNDIYFAGTFQIPQKRILPTDFDNASYAANNNVVLFALTSSSDLAVLSRKRNFQGFCRYIADNLCSKADTLFRPDYAPIVKALVLGDKTTMPYETRQLFALSGTAHILAVSGLHTGIITSIILLFSGFVKSKKHQRLIKFIILAVSLFAYSAVTGFSPSVCRSAFVAVITYFVYLIDRNPEPINILSFCVILLILMFPNFYTSIGFRMSVLSVFGIMLLYNTFNNNIGFLLRKSKINSKFISSSLALTFSSSIIISPIVSYNFSYFAVLSPIANLFVIPLMSLAMISAVIVFPLSYIAFPIAHFLANTTDLLIMLSTEINKFIISIPFAYISSGDNNNIILLSTVVSVLLLYILTFKYLRQFYFRIGVVAVCTVAMLYIIYSLSADKGNSVTIYPLKTLAVAEIPMQNGKIFYYLADRKNKQLPRGDYNLQKYLASQIDAGHKIVLGLTGNSGIATYDLLKANYKNKIKPIALNFTEQRQIDSLLCLNKRLPQITDKIKYE